MRIRMRSLRLGAALAVVAVFALMIFPAAASGSAQHVRWDIISFVTTTPPTFNPGGFAEAKAPDDTKIRFTGSGTFVASGNRPSGAVTGGGTWQTFAADGTSTGSGTYVVLGLVTFEFANLQTGTFTDNIGDTSERANGTAVLRIGYSDGTRGVLTVGCHGPGAPDGIFEGIAVTMGFKTYYNVQPPAAGVDANRTLFHVAQ